MSTATKMLTICNIIYSVYSRQETRMSQLKKKINIIESDDDDDKDSDVKKVDNYKIDKFEEELDQVIKSKTIYSLRKSGTTQQK